MQQGGNRQRMAPKRNEADAECSGSDRFPNRSRENRLKNFGARDEDHHSRGENIDAEGRSTKFDRHENENRKFPHFRENSERENRAANAAVADRAGNVRDEYDAGADKFGGNSGKGRRGEQCGESGRNRTGNTNWRARRNEDSRRDGHDVERPVNYNRGGGRGADREEWSNRERGAQHEERPNRENRAGNFSAGGWRGAQRGERPNRENRPGNFDENGRRWDAEHEDRPARENLPGGFNERNWRRNRQFDENTNEERSAKDTQFAEDRPGTQDNVTKERRQKTIYKARTGNHDRKFLADRKRRF